MTNDLPVLPGRLGRSDMTLNEDPRADPRMVAALAPLGLGGAAAPSPATADTPIDELLEYIGIAEEGFEALFGLLASATPTATGVTRTVEVIEGIGGNDVTLFVHRPTGVDGSLPGILHIQGGGMVLLEAAG